MGKSRRPRHHSSRIKFGPEFTHLTINVFIYSLQQIFSKASWENLGDPVQHSQVNSFWNQSVSSNSTNTCRDQNASKSLLYWDSQRHRQVLFIFFLQIFIINISTDSTQVDVLIRVNMKIFQISRFVTQKDNTSMPICLLLYHCNMID